MRSKQLIHGAEVLFICEFCFVIFTANFFFVADFDEMPSAVRQKLHVDSWHQGQQKFPNGNSGPVHHAQEMQASPGHCDVFQEDGHQKHQGSRKLLSRSPRRHNNSSSLGSPKTQHRRGSADVQNVGLTDLKESAGSDRQERVELASSAKSNSCLSNDAYAMGSSNAPHPSEVPFPPLEWLQCSPKHLLSSVVSGTSLKAILACHVAA